MANADDQDIDELSVMNAKVQSKNKNNEPKLMKFKFIILKLNIL